MFLIVIAIILALVAAVFFFVSFKVDHESDTSMFRFISFGVATVAAILAFFASIVFVDAGEVIVPVRFGAVLDPIAVEGASFIDPFAATVSMPVRTVELTFAQESEGNGETGLDPISTLSAEGASVSIDATLLYHVDPQQAGQVYRTVGTTWEDTLVIPRMRTSMRDCLPNFEFEEARTSKRLQAAECVRESMAAALGDRGIVVEDVLLREMRASAELQAAIDQKLQAQNAVKEAEFLQQKAIVEKDTALIQAQAYSDAEIERARGIAESNRLVALSLTDELLQLRIVEALGDNAVYFFGGTDGAQPRIDVPLN